MVRSLFRIYLLLFITVPLFAQEPDITPYLKQIEAGDASGAREQLKLLVSRYPASPSVMFLDAVLTQEGRDAVAKYSQIAENHPSSTYADVSLYRIYSYYFALGFYNTAKTYLERLKSDYPASPYIKYAERTTPDEDLDKPFLAAEELSPEILKKSGEKHPDTKRGEIKGKEVKKAGNEKAGHTYKFTIQAGAFLSIDNARNLKNALEAEGYASDIREKEVGGSILKVVYAGKFRTADEARPVLEIINRDHKLSGRIVPLN